MQHKLLLSTAFFALLFSACNKKDADPNTNENCIQDKIEAFKLEADAESIIEVNRNPLTAAAGDVGRTEARIGSNVVIDTVGDFNLAARENVDVEARASSKTWGLAAYADGFSKSDIHSRSTTSVSGLLSQTHWVWQAGSIWSRIELAIAWNAGV